MGVELVVSSVGMVSPVGVNATQNFTSVWANIPRKRERPDIYLCLPADPHTDEPEPLVASAITHLGERWRDRPMEWLAFLAAHAFADLWRKANLDAGDHVGLFLSLPRQRPAWGADIQGPFSKRFCDFAACDGFSYQQFSQAGACGAIALCADACRLLRDGKIRHAVVGGVDSYLFPQWLEPLDRAYRLGSSRNLDGFCPGEAAAFFLIETAEEALRRSLRPWAKMVTTTNATCAPGPAGHDGGTALADAVLRAMPARATTPPLVVCDLNGEMSRAKEWGYALARLGQALPSPLALEHPAAVLGDVGAAAGAAQVVLAVHDLHARHRDRSSALVWATSDGGARHAVLLERSQPASGSPLGP
jgi:3-oxoacyl-[acyl-carrier-protein] synthase-1